MPAGPGLPRAGTGRQREPQSTGGGEGTEGAPSLEWLDGAQDRAAGRAPGVTCGEAREHRSGWEHSLGGDTVTQSPG